MSSNARQLAANLPREGGLSSRNMVINGACTVAQRASSFGSIAGYINNYYTTDRFQDVVMNLGAWTSENSTDAPEGFSRSHKRTCTSGFPSPDPSAYAAVRYVLEAQDLQRLDYGLSSAKPMTLSFWVKSNKTGSGSIDITQPDNSYRMWSNSYTINTADTWEYKTLTIPADTSGLIDDDTGAGLMLLFWLNSGSTFTGGSHQTTWGANTVANRNDRNASNLGVGGAVDDYWQITGVQLEVGDTATPFEHEPYSVTLQKAQRYFFKMDFPQTSSFAFVHKQSADTIRATIVAPQVLRSLPSINGTGQPSWGINYEGGTFSNTNGNGWSIVSGSLDGSRFVIAATATGVATNIGGLYGYFGDFLFDAEL